MTRRTLMSPKDCKIARCTTFGAEDGGRGSGQSLGPGRGPGGHPGGQATVGNWRGTVWGKACRERHEFPDLSELGLSGCGDGGGERRPPEVAPESSSQEVRTPLSCTPPLGDLHTCPVKQERGFFLSPLICRSSGVTHLRSPSQQCHFPTSGS